MRNCTHSSKRSALTSWSGLKNMCNWVTELCGVGTDEHGEVPPKAPGICVKKEGTWAKSSCVAMGSTCKMGFQNTGAFSCCPGLVCSGSKDLGKCVPKADTENDGYSYLSAGSSCDVSLLSGTSLQWTTPCRDGFYCRVSGDEAVCRSKEDDDFADMDDLACFTKGTVKTSPAVPCCPEPGNVLKMKIYCGCKNNLNGDCKETADCCSSGLKCRNSKCVKLGIGDSCTYNSQCDFPHGHCGKNGKCIDIRNFRCKQWRCNWTRDLDLFWVTDRFCNNCPGKNYDCRPNGNNVFDRASQFVTGDTYCKPN